MSKNFDYTASAQRFAARFPRMTYLGIQITFWIFANLLLGILLHLQSLRIAEALGISPISRLRPILESSVILGFLYGIGLGLTDYYLDRSFYKKLPLGKIILLKTVISLLVLVLLIYFVRFVLTGLTLSASNNRMEFIIGQKSWRFVFYTMLIYYSVMTLVINFINQVNKKYGPGVLVPLLLGRYRNPREEDRIFMFMDLKSSTATAEKLGHLKYSSFIRDSFGDINEVLFPFNAQVYQYVGDEIVLTWIPADGLKNSSCIRFFFACENRFRDRSDYYFEHYGRLPNFKAGVHMGKVTAVEIGEIKRDIAYHGDTLNTTARIQQVCNEYNRKLLSSEFLLRKMLLNGEFKTEALGEIQLRGKIAKVAVISIDPINSISPDSSGE